MSKKNAAPTIPWVLTSQVYKWVTVIFFVVVFIVFVSIWTVTWGIRRDCEDVYKRNVETAGYWIHLTAGSTKPNCPQQ